jgi:glycosyltransferase involved in cell wall biosynthesis
MRVLITAPDFNMLGGVSSYVSNLRGRFGCDVDYFTVGRRASEGGPGGRVGRLFTDYARFVSYLKNHPVDVVHINPSLDWKGIVRDGMLARAAARRGIPVVLFFHAWAWRTSESIERHWLWLFKMLFGGAMRIVVLDKKVSATLRKWGFQQPITQEVSVVPDERLCDFNLDECLARRKAHDRWRMLFMARVVKEKGIYEALDAHALLSAKYKDVELIVAGDGEDLARAKSYAAERRIPNVQFLGRVDDGAKWRLYEECDALFLPTYREGCPTAMVEAMSRALPVVIRSVGCVPEVIEEGVNGFTTESYSPGVFAALLERLYLDRVLGETMGRANAAYARNHFAASEAAARLERIYATCMKAAAGHARAFHSVNRGNAGGN